MPVSRKRKKKPGKSGKSGSATRSPGRRPQSGLGQSAGETRNALSALVEHRRQLDERREAAAAAAAEAIVAELVEVAPAQTDAELEDGLCARLGARLHEWSDGPIEEDAGPHELVEATVFAAATAVDGALRKLGAESEGWRAPWRVLTTVARIAPFPLSEAATHTIKHLRALRGGRVLPATPADPAVTGQVLWTRDSYGSRFGVTAAFSTPGGPDRWYLWDIDACGHQVFTVHSGYYATPEQALAAWQAGVGPVAARDTAFTPVDDPALLAELMPAEEGFMRPGGENEEQFAEYHRSKRLAEAVIDVTGRSRAEDRVDLDPASAATQFAAWLRAHRADLPEQAELDELTEELAQSWCINTPQALCHTCSPHRTALTALHMRDYYQDDFADQLIALLPDWTCWLAERNGTPPDLADRCRPYALGEPHAGLASAGRDPEYLARVIE